MDNKSSGYRSCADTLSAPGGKLAPPPVGVHPLAAMPAITHSRRRGLCWLPKQ